MRVFEIKSFRVQDFSSTYCPNSGQQPEELGGSLAFQKGMRLALALLTAVVLLSLAFNADAEGASRYDQIFALHQQGLLTIPAKKSESGEYLCYSRSNPNTPTFLVVDAYPNHVRRMQANSEHLSRLVAGLRVPLSPVQLPIFNGTLLGGRSSPDNVMEAFKRPSPPLCLFRYELSYGHGPTTRRNPKGGPGTGPGIRLRQYRDC